MNKRIAFIIITIIIVLAASIAVWFFLRPMLKAQMESNAAYNDAWKLEHIQGCWASENEKYALDIDAYDYALKIDGVYAMVASIQFNTSEKPQEGNTYFTLQIDPSSIIYPDAEGADDYEIDALWYKDGMIYMHLNASEDVETNPVCLLRIKTAMPAPAWSRN